MENSNMKTLLAVMMVLAMATAGLAADPSGGPGKVGATGGKQRGPIPYKKGTAERMPGHDKLLAPGGAADALVSLDKLDLSPGVKARRAKAKSFEETARTAAKPANEPGSGGGGTGGEGAQSKKPAEKARLALARLAEGPGKTKLLLKIREDGTSEVLAVQHLPGKPVRKPNTVRGPFVAEVVRGESTIAVETMDDPFELRGLADPKNPGEGHSIGRAAEALISVDVPDRNADGVSVKLMRFKRGRPIPDRLDAKLLAKERGNLDTIARVPAEKVSLKLKERRGLADGATQPLDEKTPGQSR